MEASCEPWPRSCGATTGWLAAGGALDPPDGSAGSDGIVADDGVFDGVGVGMADGVTDADAVGVGGGFGEWAGFVGAIDSTGGGMNVCVAFGVGGAASTEMVPRPDRIPSLAVTVADFVATYDAEADAGVLAGSRDENDEPDTLTVTVTSVRLANRTQPPV